MRVFRAAAILALLAGPVYAQSAAAPVPRYGDLSGKTPQQIEEEKATDKAYKKSLGNIPERAAPTDPWGSTRSASEPKADAKSAAKTTHAKQKIKTGGTVN